MGVLSYYVNAMSKKEAASKLRRKIASKIIILSIQ